MKKEFVIKGMVNCGQPRDYTSYKGTGGGMVYRAPFLEVVESKTAKEALGKIKELFVYEIEVHDIKQVI